MNGLKLRLLTIGYILASLCSSAWATEQTLPYDQVVTGSISSITQTNKYTFTADKGDVLNFTVVATKSTSGTFGPCIQLYDLNNKLVDGAGGGYSADVEMNGYQVVLTGTYTALISDCANAATGDYVISVQKTNDPVGSASLKKIRADAAPAISSTVQEMKLPSPAARPIFTRLVAFGR